MKLALQLRPYLNAALVFAYAVLAWRLYRTQLHRVYRWFFAYVTFETVRVAVMSSLDIRTNLYTELYFVTQPITWILYLLVLLELNQAALRNHPGIASFGRKFVGWALIGATVASLASLFLDLSSPSSGSAYVATFLLIERLVMLSLLLFLLLLTAFLAYFPIPVNRNLVIHARIFAIFFFFKTLVLIFRNMMSGDTIYTINTAVQVLSLVCLTGWITLLSKEGERVAAPSSRWRDTASEQRVLAQLDAINQTLLSSAKKT